MDTPQRRDHNRDVTTLGLKSPLEHKGTCTHAQWHDSRSLLHYQHWRRPRMGVFLLKRLISLPESIMDQARGQNHSLISPRISFQLVRINTLMLAGTCDVVISSVTQQITHYSDFIGLIEEKLRLRDSIRTV